MKYQLVIRRAAAGTEHMEVRIDAASPSIRRAVVGAVASPWSCFAEKLRAVIDHDMTSFNDTERLVIELADAMTDTPANVSDDLYEGLRNQFSEEQLMQLGGQIAFENYRARWNRIFNVESDNLYTPKE